MASLLPKYLILCDAYLGSLRCPESHPSAPEPLAAGVASHV